MSATVKGVVFDMDGTLTVPTIDFQAMRADLGVPPGVDLLQAMNALSPAERAAFAATIERHELRALDNLVIQEGADECLTELERHGVKLGLLTRNLQRSVDAVLARLTPKFHPVLTRDFPAVKPDPAPVLHILAAWGIEPGDAVVVGDFKDDMLCAKRAGALACFFQNPGMVSYSDLADFSVSSYRELRARLLGA